MGVCGHFMLTQDSQRLTVLTLILTESWWRTDNRLAKVASEENFFTSAYNVLLVLSKGRRGGEERGGERGEERGEGGGEGRGVSHGFGISWR